MGHFLGGILILVFLFPSLLQFEHLFENHKHATCNDNTVHFHQKSLNCNIYDFHFSFFSFHPNFPEDVILNIPPLSPAYAVLSEVFSNLKIPYSLRGPPTMLDDIV
jgi:hypothetical protein